MHRAFRIKNIFIILLTQWAVWYVVFKQHEEGAGLSTSMSYLDIILLGIVTALIAIGAYIINDVYDQEADKHNGLERIKNKKKSILTYWSMNALGLIISFYLAFTTSSLGLIWIYPLSVLTLYLYSRLLKGTPLMGNFIVALFCALVPGILFLAERAMISSWKINDISSWQHQKELLWMLVLFSFLSTMYREQVKDLEDTIGDKAAGYLTLPVVYGEARAKALALFSGLLLIVSIIIYSSVHWSIDVPKFSAYVVLQLSLLASVYLLYHSHERYQYGRVSKIIKYGMLAGLLYILIIPQT